jgi:hypothetical protein
METVTLESDRFGRLWFPLSKKTMETLGVEIGDWVGIGADRKKSVLRLAKTKVTAIKLKNIEPELWEALYAIRDAEGYYTDEETVSNAIRKGLAAILEKKGDRAGAEKLRNTALVQVHGRAFL